MRSMTEAELPARVSPVLSSAEWVTGVLKAAGPPLLFGLGLWASVCLALYIAFWLELDNAYWAGTSAAIVCQPHLGASLRKVWYRLDRHRDRRRRDRRADRVLSARPRAVSHRLGIVG